MTEVLPTGVALVPVGLGAAGAFLAYLSVATGLRLSAGALRSRLAGG
jgi:hypothetical protein